MDNKMLWLTGGKTITREEDPCFEPVSQIPANNSTGVYSMVFDRISSSEKSNKNN